jgi:hypothetical protein
MSLLADRSLTGMSLTTSGTCIFVYAKLQSR